MNLSPRQRERIEWLQRHTNLHDDEILHRVRSPWRKAGTLALELLAATVMFGTIILAFSCLAAFKH